MGMEDKDGEARRAFEAAKQPGNAERLSPEVVEPKTKAPQPTLTPKGSLRAAGDAEAHRAMQSDKARTFRDQYTEAKARGERNSFSMRDVLKNDDRNSGRSRGD